MEAINVEELRKELASSKFKVDQWASDRLITAQNMKESFMKTIRDTKGNSIVRAYPTSFEFLHLQRNKNKHNVDNAGKIKELEARQEHLSRKAKEVQQREWLRPASNFTST